MRCERGEGLDRAQAHPQPARQLLERDAGLGALEGKARPEIGEAARRRPVPVHAQRERRVLMPELVHYGARIGPERDQQRGEGVPQLSLRVGLTYR